MLLLLCWFNLSRSTRISYLLTFESLAYIGFTLSRSCAPCMVEAWKDGLCLAPEQGETDCWATPFGLAVDLALGNVRSKYVALGSGRLINFNSNRPFVSDHDHLALPETIVTLVLSSPIEAYEFPSRLPWTEQNVSILLYCQCSSQALL